MKRVLIPLLFFGVAAAAYVVVRTSLTSDDDTPKGKATIVTVLDVEGHPIPGAQVRPANSTVAWKPCDDQGTLRLYDLPLKMGEEERAESVAAAVLARAPFYTLRRGTRATATQGSDGLWHVSFRLTHHGVLRITIRDTHLGDLRASVHASTTPTSSIEAMDGRTVARPDLPAAFRVYPDCKRLVIMLRSDGDPAMARAATQMLDIRPPSPGAVLDRTLIAEAAEKIVGRIKLPDDLTLPVPSGEVRIEQVTNQDSAPVVMPERALLRPNGTFIVSSSGKGLYRLSVKSLYVKHSEVEEAKGGADVVLNNVTLWPWLVVRPNDPRLGSKPLRICVFPEGNPDNAITYSSVARRVIRLPLTQSGRHVVQAVVQGTASSPPFSATTVADATDHVGPMPVELTWTEADSSLIQVMLDATSNWKSRGARIEFQPEKHKDDRIWPRIARNHTVFDAAKDPQNVGRLSAGHWVANVRFVNTDTAMQRLPFVSGDADTKLLTIPKVAGGRIHLRLASTPEPLAAELTRRGTSLTATYAKDESPYEVNGAVEFRWDAQVGAFVATHALLPGSYKLTVAAGLDAKPDSDSEEPKPTIDVAVALSVGDPVVIELPHSCLPSDLARFALQNRR